MIVQPFSFLSGSAGGGGGIPTTNLILDLNPEFDVYSDYSGTTPQTTDGGSVGNLGDQSSYTYVGNPMSARQLDDAEKPLYYSSDSNRNNKPYLLFDGSDRYMVMEPYSGAYNINGGSSGNGGSTGKTGLTAYIVADPSAQDYDGGIINKNTDFYHDDGFNMWMNSSENLEAYYVDEGFPDYNLFTNTDPIINTAGVYSYAFNTSDTVGDRVNSLRVKNAGSNTGTRTTGSTNNADSSFTLPNVKMLISGMRTTSGNPSTLYTFDGKIFRVLLYHECHDETTQKDIMDELGSIYNI